MSDSINFKKLRETATTVLQGDYKVVADKVTFKKTQKDAPMWVINLKVTDGPFAGRTVNLNLILSHEHNFMVKRFFKFMGALGADDKFFDANPSPDAVSAHVQGRHAIATFKEGAEFRGEKREEVEDLRSADGAVVTVAASSLPKATALSPAAPVVTVSAPAAAGAEAPEYPF